MTSGSCSMIAVLLVSWWAGVLGLGVGAGRRSDRERAKSS